MYLSPLVLLGSPYHVTITFQTELLLSFENFQISLYHLIPDPSLIHLDLVNLTVLITCPWQSFPYCRSPKDGRKATWVFSNLNFHWKALQWESIQHPWLWLFGIKRNDSGNVTMSQVWGCWVTKEDKRAWTRSTVDFRHTLPAIIWMSPGNIRPGKGGQYSNHTFCNPQ